jgi:hypothetical protein
MGGQGQDLIAGLELKSEADVQAYLDSLPYSAEHANLCPRRVVEEQRANCFDGALFAAAGLQMLGHAPLILEMTPNSRDDEHLIAPFRRNARWGALAKSNFVCLRFREPVYRSLRELVMSYFDVFFNEAGERTLRGYKRPLNLQGFAPMDWTNSDRALGPIIDRLEKRRVIRLITLVMVDELIPLDERSLRTYMQGVNPDGLFHLDSSAGGQSTG